MAGDLVTLILSKALVCYAGQCFPALVGPDTPPPGLYQMAQRYTESPGYGGDVLQFLETEEKVYAIHRVWRLDQEIDRMKAIRSPDISQRIGVTKGCVNVEDDVYRDLVECCRTLEIIP